VAIDPKLMDRLTSRRGEALLGGGQDKIDKRHAKGVLTASERIDHLYDQTSFQEMGMLAQHDCHDFGLEEKTSR
jgi:propionyl-CoA carboxylase beta chain